MIRSKKSGKQKLLYQTLTKLLLIIVVCLVKITGWTWNEASELSFEHLSYALIMTGILMTAFIVVGVRTLNIYKDMS